MIQLWKGWCPKFLGFLGIQAFPGGIGAEVGIYRRIPGKLRPTTLPFLAGPLGTLVLDALGSLADEDLWWPFPELGAKIEFTLTSPVADQQFFTAGPQKSYWLAKWMDDSSYGKYQTDQGQNAPSDSVEYLMDYRINGISYPRWSIGKPLPRPYRDISFLTPLLLSDR